MRPISNRPLILLTLLLPLGLGLLMLPGCFDNEDIDRRVIVSPIGIDAASNGKLLVTLRLPLISRGGQTQGGESNQMKYITRSAFTQGIFPALIDIQKRDEHDIFIGQCRAIVFGETVAKKGLKPVLDFFSRMPTFPLSAFVVIARPNAAKIMEINWPEQETFDQNIRSYFSNQSNQIYGIKKWMFFRNIYDPFQDPVVPIMTPSDRNTAIKLLGLAVFRGDRMTGELNSEETALWALLRNLKRGNHLVIPLSCGISMTFQVATGKKKLKVTYAKHPVFKLELKLHAFIGELSGGKAILNPRELHQLEVKSAGYLQQKYLGLFHKLQVMKSDPLELGNTYRIQQPKHFLLSKWPEEYRKAEFQVKVKVFIERLGVLK
jgi:Ger(x)C family germination protein